MPKVLRLTNRLNLGGISYNACYLSKYIDDDFETLFLSGQIDTDEASAMYIAENLGLKPVIVNSMHRKVSFINDLKAIRELIKHIKRFKPDIVHTHTSKPGVIGRIAAFYCRVPVTVHTFHGHVFHSYFGKLKTEFYRQVEKFLAKRSSKIIAISPEQKYDLVEKYKVVKENKVKVVSLGFDLDRFKTDRQKHRENFRKKYNIDDDTVAIGIIGRMVPIKNHHLFIDTIEQLLKISKKKIVAVLIGDGELRKEIEAYITSKKIDKKLFIFTSWITQIELAMHGLDIIALTSKNEGTPVSLIEAGACAKPIVSANVGGVNHVLLDQKSGLLCNSDPVELANGIKFFIDNPVEASEYGKRGEVHVNKHFSYKRLAKDVSDLYRSLLEEVKSSL